MDQEERLAKATRQKNADGQRQLDEEREEHRDVVEPEGKLLHEPAAPGRQRRGLIVIGHRRQVQPSALPGGDLGESRLEQEPEQKPAQEENDDR